MAKFQQPKNVLNIVPKLWLAFNLPNFYDLGAKDNKTKIVRPKVA